VVVGLEVEGSLGQLMVVQNRLWVATGIVLSLRKMAFPIKTCVKCGEEFELKPGKPGFANRCPECSADDDAAPAAQHRLDADERKSMSEANEARRRAMRDLLYRKDS
jgi:hypothetical protein